MDMLELDNDDFPETYCSNIWPMIKYVLCSPIRLTSWFILRSLGWSNIPENFVVLLKEGRYVWVSSHTSFWDFWLALLYLLSYPELTKNIYTISSPQPFEKWYACFLHYMNFIPTKRLEDPSIGFVGTIVKTLKPKENFVLALSPEGKLPSSEWRSGYYYIAKELKIPIYSIGFDYELKRPIICTRRNIEDYADKDEMEKVLQEDMEIIVPLYEEGSFTKVREHQKGKVYWCDPIHATNSFICAGLIVYSCISKLYL